MSANDNDSSSQDFATLAVRAGQLRSEFGEHSEALYLTSSFVFRSAEEAAERFRNPESGNVYTRFTNPTVNMFQQRLAALEGSECCLATGSGMAAILATVMGLLKAGDEIVSSKRVFGSVLPLFNQIMARFGVTTRWVLSADPTAWQAAVSPKTRLLFVETPSNPTLQIYDIAALSAIAKKAGAWLAVDNCVCSPALQRPIEFSADLVIHSATKFLDGQGRVLGGAICGKRELLMDGGIYNFIRTAGPVLSPFNAWVLLKGLETLAIRMAAHSAHAARIAVWLADQKGVTRVFYPGLTGHAKHDLAMKQQSGSGAPLVAFELAGGRDAAFRFINATRTVSITGNMGDAKTTIIHPATTTHGRLAQAERDEVGVTEGLIRLSIGLESPADVEADLARGFKAL